MAWMAAERQGLRRVLARKLNSVVAGVAVPNGQRLHDRRLRSGGLLIPLGRAGPLSDTLAVPGTLPIVWWWQP